MVIGPAMLGLAGPDDVALLSDLGMGFLFLLAGYELQPSLLTERVGRRAGAAWCTSLLLAAGVVVVAIRPASVEALVAGAIALTTTALGVLLPVLQDGGRLDSRLGRAVLVIGAYGELGPIVAMALLLGTRGSALHTEGAQRFSRLQRRLGISPKVLTAKLREMERDGLVSRRAFGEVPPRVEYEVTELGLSLQPVFEALGTWWNEHERTVREARTSYTGPLPR